MLDVESALCAQTDPELFFPETQQAYVQINQAKAICAECDIRMECLKEALTYEYTDGIWGGTTPSERARLGANLSGLPYTIRMKARRTRNAKGDSQ
jgi:WhiB family redox-sensing transcriptional regulator